MRIHRLEVQAFGPFADRVVVDVDDLASGGLFLVRGPTGSGKTSLLDAVCFALYADVPGARARQALRSDHAAPDVVPEVLLEVTVGGRRLRLTRSPAWHRPKKRGAGLTPVQAGVLLEERRGTQWVTVSTRHDEVADVVKDVLGMGLAQFAKVVLLPQGEFAAFLRASPEDRREVLERLFDIEVFSDVEHWLTEQRRALGGRLDDARAALASDLSRVEESLAESASLIPAPAPDTAGDADDDACAPLGALADVPVELLPARLASLSTGLGRALTTAMADADAASGTELLAQAALADARERAAARTRGLRARERAAALLAEAEAHETRSVTLAAAERAATLGGHLRALERAEDDLAEAEHLAGRRRASVLSLGIDLGQGSPRDVASRVHAHDDAAADLGRHAERALTIARAVSDADERLASTRAACDDAASVLATATAEVDTLTERTARLRALAATAPERRLRAEAGRERLALHAAIDSDRARRAELVPRLTAARDGLLEAQDALIDRRRRRLDGMAAELADSLSTGSACPVCGSVDHPRPAVAGDHVSPDDLAAAEHALEEARGALARLEAADTRLAAAVDARVEALAGSGRADVESEVREAEEALEQADRAADDLERAEGELAQARVDAEQLDAAHARLSATAAALEERLGELGEEAAAARAAIEEAVAAHASCPCAGAAAEAHARAAEALDELTRAEEARESVAARLRTTEEDLASAVAEAGFGSTREARRARRTDDEVEQLRSAVGAHLREADACRAVLEEPEVAAALDAEPPDLEALDEAARAARRAVLATTTSQETLARAGRALQRLRPGIEAACAELTDLTARHARVRELADVVSGTGGDNTLRMRLTSFVLAARLETVAALANERLQVMGAGRYLLEHSDDRAARGARSGLGLRVLDQWTGRARDPASLSGGESFMASLALALGLADAVREEAGGLDLGTLFVDEGFGSLDEDSLEEVLTVLDGLREGGRAVGVVSHVADLRARIPHQAVVHKGTAGSTVEVRTAATSAA